MESNKVVENKNKSSLAPLFICLSGILLGIVIVLGVVFNHTLKENNNLVILNKKLVLEATPQPKEISPLDTPEVVSLADCVIKLQPKTTPFVAKFMAMNIIKESKLKKLDPDLVLALIYTESEINPNALSQKGAVGLMQVRFQTWKAEPELKDNGVDVRHKLFWIDSNIKCGTDILARYIEESKGNIGAALYRYNTGDPKMTKRPWEIEYVSKVLYYHYKIREHKLNGVMLEEEELMAAPTPVNKK